MKPEYSKELLAEMWKKLNLAREFETRVQWLFSMGLVHGTTHLGIGEEATAVGSILALKPQDYVFGTHRGHSQAIAKGIDIDHMMVRSWQRRPASARARAAPCTSPLRISTISPPAVF